MADHVQPTKEELEAQIAESEKTLAALAENPIEEVEEEAEVVEETPEEQQEESQEPVKEVKHEAEESQDEIDYKEKYIHSTREAQILSKQLQQQDKAIEEATQINDLSEQDLAVEATRKGFSLDDMSVVEKALFKTSVLNERKLAKIAEVAEVRKDLEAWNTKVDQWVSDPKVLADNPRLEGKQDEFKLFAGKPTRRGLDFPDLVSAFLYTVDTTRKPNKGQMLETGQGGDKKPAKPESDKISIADAKRIMDTDYRKYKELLKAGKIQMDVS